MLFSVLHAVVRRLFCDIDVVRVRLTESGARYLDELPVLLQIGDSLTSAVSHAGADSADELEHGVCKRAFVRNAALDAFRHEFCRIRLEISVLRALFHGTDRAHAAIDLEPSALIDLAFAGAFLAPCEERADHDDVSARGERFHYVSAVFYAAVCDDGDVVFCRDACDVVDRRDLRHADAGDDARRTDRAGTDADFDCVGARFDEVFRRLGRRDVAADDLAIRECVFDLSDRLHDAFRVTVRRVEHEHVDARLDKCARALENVFRDAYRRAAKKPSAAVFCGIRVLRALLYILGRDKAFEVSRFVDEREFFDLVRREDLQRFRVRRSDVARDEIVLRHDLADLSVHVGKEAHVAVCDDADEDVVFVDDRHARDLVFSHQRLGFVNVVVWAERKRIRYNAVLTSLYPLDLVRLHRDGHVLMNDADAAFARHRDRHSRFGNGVHRARHYRRVEHDFVRKSRSEIYHVGRHFALRRDEQHVVKRDAFFEEFFSRI